MLAGNKSAAVPQIRTQAKGKPYGLKIFISDVEKRKECLRGNSYAGQELRRATKALPGKRSCANSFAKRERGTNAADNRRFTCQSDTFS
jgi:hypothetical protein